MDPGWVREREAQCTQEEPPACTAACPVHVDARALVDRVRQGDFAGGLAVLARHVPFPGLLAWTCDRACESACKRGEVGDPVEIGAVERACVEFGGPAPAGARLPVKARRVAVVGAGLSGLTAAVELARRGYPVELFEAGPSLLERLRVLGPEVLPAGVIEADLRALAAAAVKLHLRTRLDGPGGPRLGELVRCFDAVYLGLGPGPAHELSLELARTGDGRIAIAALTHATSHPRVFAGGTHRYAPFAYSSMRSLQDGMYAAISIDRLLQGASITARRENQGPFTTRLHVSLRGVAPSPRVVPAGDGRGYSGEEAIREARRCLPCECLECVRVCEYLAHYGSYPRRYVRQIYNNDCIVLGAHLANRMVNSCTLCGLCAAVCPEKLPMAEVCLKARRSMVAKGKMPPSAHEFALLDMESSLGEAFALARHEPGRSTSAALFFPGCQLAGSSPEHVLHLYDWLRKTLPGGVGLLLGCCGAPARWAGREEVFRGVLHSLEETWRRMGEPRLVTACPSCARALRDGLPALELESLWTVLEPPSPPAGGRLRKALAIHDPCASRDDAPVQQGVRRLLAKLGVDAIELGGPALTTCCGFGGLARFANPDVAGKIVRRRATESTADYVTYCAMCRDSFAREGKRALHVLDLLFEEEGTDPAWRADPGLSGRRENRARLKLRLLREVWKEAIVVGGLPVRLDVSQELIAHMEQRMILLEDVRRVIEHAERTGEKLVDERSGRFLASHRPANVTYWVEYSALEGGYAVHDAYSHRMQVG